jgi:multidrug efflux pump subunit AcrA (membrane-fusion protein)
MLKTRLFAGLLVLATLLLTVGCGGEAATAATATTAEEVVPVVVSAEGTIIAEAVIEPARWSELYFDIAGEVVEVLVKEGDPVVADAPLLRLDTDELAISLQSAQEDVVAQRAALDRLIAGATEKQISRADKENADQIAQAEVALQAATLQLEKARLEDPAAEVDAARARIAQLELQLAQAKAQSPAEDVTVAQVALERAQIALDDAQDEYNKALDRPWEDQDIRDGWARELEQKKLDHRQAQAQLDRAQRAYQAHAIGVDVLEVQIRDAKIRLTQATAAQEAYAVTLDILAAEVESARLQVEALHTWDNPYLDEATAEEIAQAEARLRQAELAVAQLELQLGDAELRAPFGGTIVELHVDPGDQVSPGQVVLVLATLDQLEARTTDLTELDVARVAVGQQAVVSVDALPDREFGGVVSEIALRSGDYRGDVVYAITVELNDIADLPLRWGMTTMVKIEAQ